MKKLLGVVAAVLALSSVTACSASYATPAAYGDSGHCFYVDSPAEVSALQHAGLCPVNWVAYPAPVWYRARYADYLAAPVYYNAYVPATVRTTYVSHVTVWNKSNSSAIQTQRVAVSNSRSSYSPGNARSSDRAGGSGSRVSVGGSSRSFSSGSRR